MDLAAVMDEVGTALARVPGLRPFPYSVDAITPPAAVVGWPDEITYDSTMGRGMDTITLPVYVLVGRVDQRSARDVLARYLDGGNPGSLKAVIERGPHVAFDSVRVVKADPQSLTSAGVDYIGAVLELNIVGKGA